MKQIQKKIIIILAIILVTAIVCKMVGIFDIVMGAAMGQVPVIGWLLLAVDYLNLLKTFNMISDSDTMVQGIKACVPLFASLGASFYIIEAHTDELEFPYNFIVGFLLCCVINAGISWILFDHLNFILTALSSIKIQLNNLMF